MPFLDRNQPFALAVARTWKARIDSSDVGPRTMIRDLMARMGHDSTRAALIYLHTAPGADRVIADALPVGLAEHD